MNLRQLVLPLLVLAGCFVAVVPARAAGAVRLELVGDARGSAMFSQDWGQALGQAGIKNVQIRSAQGPVKVGIQTQGTADAPIYVVTGTIVSREELLLPGGRFRRDEIGRLAQWLDDLAERGPAETREQKVAFGLSAAQFQKVRADLAAPVGFATQNIPRRQVVEKIAERLKLPLRLDSQTAEALGNDNIAEELSLLSCGTALAYVLRSAGYCLAPRAAGSQLAYAVVKAEPALEVWSVGWASEKSAKETLPAMFEFLNVNVQNVSAAEALGAIVKRVKTPVLIDHKALAQHGIDPAKVMVTFPSRRTTYGLALRNLLFQARLKYEVRCDEAGVPFLWVTSIKPT